MRHRSSLPESPLGSQPACAHQHRRTRSGMRLSHPSDPTKRLHLAPQLDLSLAHRGTNRRLTALPAQWLAPSSSYCTGPDQYLRPGLFVLVALVYFVSLFLFLFAFSIYYADRALPSLIEKIHHAALLAMKRGADFANKSPHILLLRASLFPDLSCRQSDSLVGDN